MFADALTGGDMKKLEAGMKAGKFKSHDLLKVAAHMKDLVDAKQLEEMMKTPEKQVIRMKNAWGSLITAMNNSGLWDLLASGIEAVTKAIQDITPHVKDIAQMFKHLYGVVETLLPLLITFWGLWKVAGVTQGVTTLAGAFKLLGAAMMRTLVWPALFLGGMFLVADAIESVKYGKEGILTDWSKEGGLLGYLADCVLSVTKIAQMLGIISKDDLQVNLEKATKRADFTQALVDVANNPSTGSFSDYAGFSKHSQAMSNLRASVGKMRNSKELEAMNPKERQQWLNRIQTATAGESLGFENDKYINTLRSQDSKQQSYQNMNPTINITIQNTEPNVTKEWLSLQMPDMFKQVIQRESSFNPNMLKRSTQ